MEAPSAPAGARLELLDWRRRVSELYAAVRSDPVPEHAWHEWRRTREHLFLRHSQSPLPVAARTQDNVPAYFDYDPAYRVTAVVTEDDPRHVTVPASVGDGYRLLDGGTARLVLAGGDVVLRLLWLDDYAGGLLLTFRDATSGVETYGAGRYVLDTAKSADLGTENGELVVDFNFAYQPSCSYDPRWSCPLPPRENWLVAPIRAGERLRGEAVTEVD